MRKLMKSIFMGAAMLALPVMLTSCEGTLDDVFGQWDRPSKIPAEVFMFKKVLDEGATLTVSFKLNDDDMELTFKKEGSKYVIQGDYDPNDYVLQKVAGKDLLELTIYKNSGDTLLGQIFFNTSDGSYYILNYFNGNVEFDGSVKVMNISGTVTNLSPDKAVIKYDDESNVIIRYNKANGDTWNTIVDKYAISSNEQMQILIYAFNYPGTDSNLEILLSNGDETHIVIYNDLTEVDPEHKIGKHGAADYTDSYFSDIPTIIAPLD